MTVVATVGGSGVRIMIGVTGAAAKDRMARLAALA